MNALHGLHVVSYMVPLNSCKSQSLFWQNFLIVGANNQLSCEYVLTAIVRQIFVHGTLHAIMQCSLLFICVTPCKKMFTVICNIWQRMLQCKVLLRWTIYSMSGRLLGMNCRFFLACTYSSRHEKPQFFCLLVAIFLAKHKWYHTKAKKFPKKCLVPPLFG